MNKSKLTVLTALMALTAGWLAGCNQEIPNPKSSMAEGDMSSPQASETAEASNADAIITASVKLKFNDDIALSRVPITIQTTEGVVALRGIVPTQTDRLRAEQIASSVEGVAAVINNLEVAQT